MKMCPCCSLNWWAFCYPKYPARAEMVTWLDVLGGKLEQKRLKPLLAVYTLIPWRKMVTLENVPKSLARFVRQMGFFRTKIFGKAVLFLMMRMSFKIRSYILSICLFLCLLNEQQHENWNLLTLFPALAHNTLYRYLCLDLETEITFASHPTGYTVSSVRPGILLVLFQSPEGYLAHRRH